MPKRLLRDWTDSRSFDGISAEGERMFTRLLMKVDDYGRFHADPRLLRAALFPFIENLKNEALFRWLGELSDRNLIILYESSDNRKLLVIPKFGQRLKQSVPKFPPPPGKPDDWLPEISDAISSSGNDDESSGKFPEVPPRSECEYECGSAEKPPRLRAAPTPKAKRPRKTMMPEGFSVSDRVKEWAQAQGHGKLDEHLDAFKRKAAAKGYEYVDWDAAFMEAIRENWAKLNASSPAPSNDDWMRRVL